MTMHTHFHSFFLHFNLESGCSIESLCITLLKFKDSLAFLQHKLSKIAIIQLKKDQLSVFPIDFKIDHILNLQSISKCLLLKTLTLLNEIKYYPSPKESIYIVIFFLIIEHLNPQFISSSDLPINCINKQSVFPLIQSIPTFDSNVSTSCDIICLAILRTCVASFSSRPSCKIIKTCTSSNFNITISQCLQRPILSQNTQINSQSLLCIEVSLCSNVSENLINFINKLKDIGAFRISFWNSTNQNLKFEIQMKIVSSKLYKDKIIKFLFQSSSTSEVLIYPIENFSAFIKNSFINLGSIQKPDIHETSQYFFNGKLCSSNTTLTTRI